MTTLNPNDVVIVDGVRSAMGKSSLTEYLPMCERTICPPK